MDDFILVLIALFAACLVGFLIGQGNATDKFQTEAIQNNFAQYNSITGDWEWKTNTVPVTKEQN